MAKNIRHLSAFTKKISKGIKRETNRLKQEVVKAIVVETVTGTPVDTSLHLSNWQVGIGTAPSGTLEAAVPGSGGSTAGSSIPITIAIANSKLIGKLLGKTIFVSNESPVIESLNQGGVVSDQPGKFVEKALSKAEQVVASFEFQI